MLPSTADEGGQRPCERPPAGTVKQHLWPKCRAGAAAPHIQAEARQRTEVDGELTDVGTHVTAQQQRGQWSMHGWAGCSLATVWHAGIARPHRTLSAQASYRHRLIVACGRATQPHACFWPNGMSRAKQAQHKAQDAWAHAVTHADLNEDCEFAMACHAHVASGHPQPPCWRERPLQ